MKKIFLSTLILGNFLCFFSTCKTKSISQAETDSSAIVNLETDFTIALMKNDTSTFEKLMAPGFIYSENEKTYSRSEMLSSLTAGYDTIDSAYNQAMTVHLFGSCAAVTGWMTVKGKNAAGTFEHKYRFTDTWLKNNVKWQLIAAHDYIKP